MVLPSFVNYQKESENEQLIIAEQENDVQIGVFGPKIGVAVLVIGSLILAVFAVINKAIPFPSAIMQSSSMEFDTYKSAARFAPLFMSSSVEKNGLVKTFFDKYGLQIPNTDVPATAAAPMIAGDPAYWVLATISTGTTCSGNVVSVGGMAGATCVAEALTSTTKSFMFTCTSGLSGAVYLTAYENDDCTGSGK